MARNGRNPGQTEEQQASQSEIQLSDETIKQLQDQLNESIQPVIQDLQQQITQAVQQQMSQSGSSPPSANGSGGIPALGHLGPVGDFLQQAIDTVVELIQRFMAWLTEKLEGLSDKLAEAIGAFAGMIVQRAVRSAL